MTRMIGETRRSCVRVHGASLVSGMGGVPLRSTQPRRRGSEHRAGSGSEPLPSRPAGCLASGAGLPSLSDAGGRLVQAVRPPEPARHRHAAARTVDRRVPAPAGGAAPAPSELRVLRRPHGAPATRTRVLGRRLGHGRRVMRVLVFGAGAVGGYFGARLAEGGHEVTFVARGENLDALRRDGLTVRLGDRALRLSPVSAVRDPVDAPPPDLVLVCVKSYDTAAAAAALRPVVNAGTILLSLQNGIENEDILARELALPPLMVACTRIGVALVAPATIEYSGRGTIVFGEVDGRETPRARRVAASFAAAGVPYELRSDVLVPAWEKLAWNAGFNAVTTLTQATVAEALAQPASRELIVAAMEEADA